MFGPNKGSTSDEIIKHKMYVYLTGSRSVNKVKNDM
jgi:hypothetical protein